MLRTKRFVATQKLISRERACDLAWIKLQETVYEKRDADFDLNAAERTVELYFRPVWDLKLPLSVEYTRRDKPGAGRISTGWFTGHTGGLDRYARAGYEEITDEAQFPENVRWEREGGEEALARAALTAEDVCRALRENYPWLTAQPVVHRFQADFESAECAIYYEPCYAVTYAYRGARYRFDMPATELETEQRYPNLALRRVRLEKAEPATGRLSRFFSRYALALRIGIAALVGLAAFLYTLLRPSLAAFPETTRWLLLGLSLVAPIVAGFLFVRGESGRLNELSARGGWLRRRVWYDVCACLLLAAVLAVVFLV